MRERRELVLLDGLVVLLSFLLGYALRFGLPVFPEKGIAPFEPYIKISGFAMAGWLIIFSVLGLYREKLFFNPVEEVCLLLQGSFWAMVFLTAGTALYRGFSYSRLALGLAGILVFLLLWLIHYLHRMLLHPGRKKVLLTGREKELGVLLQRLQRHAFLNFDLRVLPAGDMNVLKAQVSQVKPDFLIANVERPEEALTFQKLAQEHNIPFYLLPEFHQFFFSGKVENIDGLPLFVSGQLPLERILPAVLKRMTDIAAGLFLFLLFCLALPWVALAIKAGSPGPVFFRQKRVGRNGAAFRIFKFRTMKYPFDSRLPYTLPDDPRITRFGRFLRRYNLDELPQIFNVLNGEMSLVGPRPIALEDTFFFTLPDFALRIKARPGITGWAQVHGLRGGHIEPQERIRYDLYYLENWSIWLDWAIILCSVFAFKNAY